MRTLLEKLPPAVIALLLQFLACALAWFSLRLSELQLAPLGFALLCGLLAAVLSYLAGLERWWLVIQSAFAPALVLMLMFNIPPGFFLAAFMIMLTVYWSTYRTQVPLYLSSHKVWSALEGLLPPECSLTPPLSRGEREESFRFIDLGSGLGGVLTHLARIRHDGH